MGITEKKCPSCGGAMRFDPESGKSVCDYCGSVFEIEEASPEKQEEGFWIEGFDFGDLVAGAEQENAEQLPIYNCVSCGAEVITAAEQFSMKCPYCGNNIIITDKISGSLRPDGVLPFKITPKELPAAMNRFYKDKVLLPKNFFTESSMSKVTGVYIPFWVFGGTLSGLLTYAASRSSSHRSGDYRITETKHYKLEREAHIDFENLPVDASGRIDDALMDSIEPFDMSEAKPFNTDYLQGFTADRFDVSAKDTEQRAVERMKNTAMGVVMREAAAGYENPRLSSGKFLADIKAKYLLLPVYLFGISYGGIDYKFAVNGQSGKVVGEIPTDKKRSTSYFLIRGLGIAAACIAAFLVKYFMGG